MLEIDNFQIGNPAPDICSRAYVQQACDTDDDARLLSDHSQYSESRSIAWPVVASAYKLPKHTFDAAYIKSSHNICAGSTF